ncbi:hypothetical protein B0H63DRAFT_194648 [Podospora didyma]|uniref:Uncharacterized protein n=1 Tax=Podospora didyma TaxID=330526 RepID=A0AAE0NG82_9PEZI|nr:hypothetical protein B0H63DRAFT_194648 [Podospora didyma]
MVRMAPSGVHKRKKSAPRGRPASSSSITDCGWDGDSLSAESTPRANGTSSLEPAMRSPNIPKATSHRASRGTKRAATDEGLREEPRFPHKRSRVSVPLAKAVCNGKENDVSQALTPSPTPGPDHKAEPEAEPRQDEVRPTDLQPESATKPASGPEPVPAAESTREPLKPANTLKHIITSLHDFPTGEIAYGGPLHQHYVPEITVGNEYTTFYPSSITDKQLDEIKAFAKARRIEEVGSSWLKLPKSPTWAIKAPFLKIHDSKWDSILKDLLGRVAAYLGLGEKTELAPRLHGLHIWESESLWRSFVSQKRSPTRVANLLIILNRKYKQGGISVGYGSSDLFFDPADSEFNQYFIAAHEGVEYDPLPVEGIRLGLSYELHIPELNRKVPYIRQLTQAVDDATDKLRSLVQSWVGAIENGEIENYPLIHVLDGDYESSGGLGMTVLSADDRARAAALQNIKIMPFGKYKLKTYIVSLTASAKLYSHKGRVVKYAISRGTNLAGRAMPTLIKDTIIKDQNVIEPEKFANGVEMKKGELRVMTTTRTCMMLVLEPIDA